MTKPKPKDEPEVEVEVEAELEAQAPASDDPMQNRPGAAMAEALEAEPDANPDVFEDGRTTTLYRDVADGPAIAALHPELTYNQFDRSMWLGINTPVPVGSTIVVHADGRIDIES